MLWSSDDISAGLYILVAVMLLIVLYHLLFVVVDLRKIMRRLRSVTEQVEAVVVKPLAMTEQVIDWMIDHFEGKKKK